MQFEYKVGSLGHELGRAVDIEALRAQSGIELAQDVVAFFAAIASDDVPLGFVLVRFAGFRVFHPVRSGRPHPHFPVMHNLGIARTHLRGLDPHVLREIGLHQNVFVVDGSGGGYLERLGHFHDDVGLDIPAVLEGQRRGLILGVAFARAVVHPRGQRGDVLRRSACGRSGNARRSGRRAMAASSWRPPRP